MNRGVIFFIIIVLAVLAIVFIPKNKDNAPATDMGTEEVSQDLQGAAIEALPEVPATDAAAVDASATTETGAEGVVEVPVTETTPEAAE